MLAAGVLTALALVLVAPLASAHDVLVASDPGEGDTLTQSPRAITLTFNNNPLAVGSAIVVTDADGATVHEGEGTVDGLDVALELPAELASGEYEASWRVASSDGHPIEGVIPFTVELPEPAEPDETVEPAEQPTEQPTAAATHAADPTTADAATAPESESETTDPAETTGSGLSALPLWLRVVIALAALGGVVGLIVRVVQRSRSGRV